MLYLCNTRFEKTMFYRPENDVFFLAKRCFNGTPMTQMMRMTAD